MRLDAPARHQFCLGVKQVTARTTSRVSNTRNLFRTPARTQSKTMATSQLRRIIPEAILVAAVLVLSTGLGIRDAAAKCPRSTPSATSQIAPPSAARQQPPAVERISATATPIWKTIAIGTYKGVDAVRAAMDAAPCPIALGDWADEILG